MAGELKQQFIEAVRATPDGIVDFLTTAIPAPPSISTPADVDAAIIANGVAAKFVCDLFQPFAGLTPVELLLRIGQHNSVLESAMIAGLEYITETEEVNDLEILAPEDGATLKPGDVLLMAQAKNGTLIQCAVEIEGHAPISLEANDDGTFEGYITIEDEGEYTANFSGLFEKDKTATASCTFTIAEEGDEPGGSNKNALQKALKLLTDALSWILKNIAGASAAVLGAVMATAQKAFNTIAGIVRKLIITDQDIVDDIQAMAQDAFDTLSTAIEEGAQDAATEAIATIKTAAAKLAALI